LLKQRGFELPVRFWSFDACGKVFKSVD